MKTRAVLLLILAEIAVLSLWFVSAAVVADMAREAPIPGFARAALSAAVQAGFVVGALGAAVMGLADRFEPRRVFAISALLAALANLALLWAPLGGSAALALRFVTGACLAGVYPVGMKIAVGWGVRDRGLLVGLLVGGLTLGSAAPHLLAWLGGAQWRATVIAASGLAALGGALVMFSATGPHHARAAAFDPRVVTLAWRDRRIRAAYGGYLGHMWELYAMWSWIGAAVGVSYAARMPGEAAESAARLTAFAAIGIGALVCGAAGWIADRIGKAELTIWAMAISGASALAAGAAFGGPVWLVAAIALVWGASVIPDSAQFSALIADYAPAEAAGSLMTFQTALGFALTTVTVQVTPMAAAAFGWPLVLASLALGPAFGIWCMTPLRRRS